LGTFILAALCAATPVYADHRSVIERYQRAYGDQPDPHFLILIGNEYRDAGQPREAVAYYCSYIFTTPAGVDADYASQQAHKLKPGESDQEVCTTAPPVMHSEDITVLSSVPKPGIISKREIAGFSLMALSIGSFAVAMHEGNLAGHIERDLIGDNAGSIPMGQLTKLKDQDTSARNKEKVFLAAGGVALVGGGILFLLGRHSRLHPERILIAPTTFKHGGGLVLGGKF